MMSHIIKRYLYLACFFERMMTPQQIGVSHLRHGLVGNPYRAIAESKYAVPARANKGYCVARGCNTPSVVDEPNALLAFPAAREQSL